MNLGKSYIKYVAILLLLFGVFFTENVSAQNIMVSGTIFEEGGEPAIGATIQIKGSTVGTITDLDGKFKLQASQGDILVISYVGFDNQEVTASSSPLTVTLKSSIVDVEEIVVIGYGTQKKKLTTGSSVQVGSDDISRVNAVDAFGALQSQAPGVNITQNSGQPGEGYKVTIRGLGTTGSSSPLYVIDGVAGGNIEALDPNDIETIDVLKDAASAAIYGARAANGVILVTTKHGKIGKVSVSYDGYYGVQNAVTNGVKTLDAKQYMEIINKANESAGSPLEDFASQIPKQYAQIMNGTWNGTNWFEESLNENAPIQSHSVNINGGSDLSRFALGFTYFTQEGTIGYPATPEYERYTIRANSDYSIWKKNKRDIIKFGENITYTLTNKSGMNIAGIYSNNLRNLLTANPLLPAYNENGDFYVYNDMVADNWDWDRSQSNPLAEINNDKNKNTRSNRLQFNAFLEISPIEGLTIKSSAGYHYWQSDYRKATPAYNFSEESKNEKDFVTQTQRYGYRWTWENTANYIKKFNQHSIDFLIGQSLEKWGFGNSLSVTNAFSRFPGSYDHAYIDNANTVTAENTSISGTPNSIGALSSVFGRINYNFRETYMLSFVMRADGSSNFAKDHRWGYFPSVSAGWVITNESFAEPITSVVNFLKLRGSWGQNGNSDISNFQYLSTIAFDANYYFDDKASPVKGAYPDILPNEKVSWETSEQLDLGFDARFFNSQLTLTFDWYKKTTKDWLVVAPQLSSYGTGAPYINGGDVENKGIEIGINWRRTILSKKFTYSIGLNLAKNKNEVTRIANEEGIIHGAQNIIAQNTDELNRVQVGYPMGYFWGYKTAGVFQTESEIEAYKAAKKPILQDNPVPGDLIFVDLNNDGVIDADDKTEIGNPHPDWTLGFNINLAYKGFDLGINSYGQFGMQIIKSYRNFSNKPNHNYTTDVYDNYWTGAGSSNSRPRFSDGKQTNFKEISDFWIEDADFLKISNITFGYDFKKVWKHCPCQKVRLYVSLQNFITITGYTGMDPEVGYGGDNQGWGSGVDLGFYPNPKTFMGGVNITF
ncbi:MAG: TonB-dependent receptor [Bacteroidales bacterium]|nr:TonB-dependent receptor [Bacteroidales bacterium]